MHDVAGLIFSGGRSSRFGTDKALTEVDGSPMIERVQSRFEPQVAHLAVAGPAHNTGLLSLDDGDFKDMGPLAGLLAGMNWVKLNGLGDWLVTSPCDVPRLPTNLVELLVNAAVPGRACVLESDGHLQAACALWPIAALPKIAERLSNGEKLSLFAALQDAHVHLHKVAKEDLNGAFTNINTQEDLAALRLRNR